MLARSPPMTEPSERPPRDDDGMSGSAPVPRRNKMDPAFSAAEKIHHRCFNRTGQGSSIWPIPRDEMVKIIRAEYAEQAKELKRLLDVAGDIHSMARDLGEDLGALTVEEY